MANLGGAFISIGMVPFKWACRDMATMHKRTMMKYALFALILLVIHSCADKRPGPPNILWITSEDMTTMLGAYGDRNACTPNLDVFAGMARRYTHAFATAPVCAPSRSCIITGFYATSLGSQHLRSQVKIPASIVPFPRYLREAGYYTTNNDKEDYNFIDTAIWDESSKEAHWRNSSDSRPFFSVFNLGLSHQSAIFGSDSAYEKRIAPYLPFIKRIAPDAVVLPPYYPDDPVIRKLWARYYTNVAIIDHQFGEIMEQLKRDGLLESTIVFYFSDHGTGMPRAKRTTYDSGLKVPLLVHVPEKYADRFHFKSGSVSDEMVSFIDFAPTVLEIAGIEQPEHTIGRPFITTGQVARRAYVFGTSDRVDEAYELARTVRTRRYRYIRNFLPHLPLLQPNFYTDQSEIMQALRAHRSDSDLTPAQLALFAPRRQVEELYDTETDPHELRNLATDPSYGEILREHRGMLREEILKTFDTGFMPEPEMIRLAQGSTPFEVARDRDQYPLGDILAVCRLMLDDKAGAGRLLEFMVHKNGFVRYWSVVVAQQRMEWNKEVQDMLVQMLADPMATVQIEAAKALVKLGRREAIAVILRHMQSTDAPLMLFASRAFQEVVHLLEEMPPDALRVYENVKQSTDHGNMQVADYYDLYTFWALDAVFR